MRFNVEEELKAVYVSDDIGKIRSQYQKKKVRKLVLFTMLLFGLAALGAYYLLQDVKGIKRAEYGMGNKEYEVSVSDGDDTRKMKVLVAQRELTGEEVEKELDQNEKQLVKEVLGENRALDRIEQPLNLVTSIGNYGTEVVWQMEGQQLIDYDGSILWEQVRKEKETLVIGATLILCGKSRQINIPFCVVMSEERRLKTQLESQINSENSRYQDEVQLPREVGGEEISYQEESGALFPFILAAAFVLLLFKQRDENLNKEYQKKRKQLLVDYPDVIGKFSLYLESGLSVVQTFRVMVKNYEKQYEQNGMRHYAYEEMRLALKKIDNGTNQTDAYLAMGNRCQEGCYIKWGNMLAQNLKKGNAQMCGLLNEMVALGFEERKARVLKESQEAGTKLLFPMLLMMLVVVAVVVIPAFLNMKL